MQGVSAKPAAPSLRNGDLTVEQLKQLVEIQTQIVKQAKQNELAHKHRGTRRRKLAGVRRRVLSFLSQLW
jgi:hypothetical protein